MKLLGYFLFACIVLAAVKAALAVLLAVLAVGLVWAAATRPRETAALLAMLILSGLVHDHGLAFLITVGVVSIIGMVNQQLKQKTNHTNSTIEK